MVLEGAVIFDLKANILISEQALGNKSEYLFCLCSFLSFFYAADFIERCSVERI